MAKENQNNIQEENGDTPLSGNAGEWSEPYVLFRLLGEHVICPCDKNLQKTSRKIPILNIIREDQGQKIIFKYVEEERNDHWVVIKDTKEIADIKPAICSDKADSLLLKIKSGKGSMSFPEVQRFLNSLGCLSLKARATSKKDITLQISDIKAGEDPTLGFSIKSFLGGLPSLLNSSKEHTNFLYKVEGIDPQEVDRYNDIKDTKNLIEELRNNNASISYVKPCSDTFHANLRYIDSAMGKVIGELLIEYYSERNKNRNNNVIKFIDKVAKRDPLQIKDKGPYRESLKRLLEAASKGMTPGTKWDGQLDETSGFIIVGSNGSVVSYHSYNQGAYKDYLLSNTKFETPDRNRHKYGRLFVKEGNVYIKLALQIRFIKPISTDEEFCES